MSLRIAVKIGVGAACALMFLGMAAQPAGAAQAPVGPAIIITVPPPTFSPPALLGDLTISRAGGCIWYRDSADGLWIAPTLAAGWNLPTAFPSNAFRMTSNYGKQTAGGPVTSTAPFLWAIGGEPTWGNSFLGHTVVLTATIDPVHTVTESNESNNTTTVTLAVPATPPPASGTVVSIPCS
jgi:hypothetical protein